MKTFVHQQVCHCCCESSSLCASVLCLRRWSTGTDLLISVQRIRGIYDNALYKSTFTLHLHYIRADIEGAAPVPSGVLMLSFLLIYFLIGLLSHLSIYSFQNRPVSFPAEVVGGYQTWL